MKYAITLTWSKITAVLILGLATFIDIKSETNGLVFMFSLPFVVGLIATKQVIDRKK